MKNKKSVASLTLAANTKKKEKSYWLNRFSGQPQKSSFPSDYERNGSINNRHETIGFSLPGEIARQFSALSKGSNARLFIFLLAGIFILLRKYTGNNDILLGIPVTRPREEEELLNSALPIRYSFDETQTYPQVLSKLEQILIEAENHQNFPVRVLSDLLGLPWASGEGFPLFDVVVSLENIHRDTLAEYSPNIMVSFESNGKGIAGRIGYNPGRYRPGTITRLINHYRALMGTLLANPHRKMPDIELLSTEEKQQILISFNNAAADFPETTPVHELIDRQAEQTPHATAIVYKKQRLSYKELKNKTGSLAAELKQKGLGPDRIAAVIIDHIPEMVVALVGILKSGAAYLPIDPDYPPERIDYIIKDSGALAIINKKFFGGPGGDFSKKPPGRRRHLYHSSHLAYIIYTSGSTGRPKGVMINHRSFIDFTTWAEEEFEHRAGYRVLLSNSYASDAAVQQIFPPLISGGTLHLIDKELRLDVNRYLEYLKTNRINNIDEVPVLMKELVARIDPHDREEKLPDLTCLSLGSEYVPIDLVKKCRHHLNHRGRIINAYGPAEASVETTTYHCDGTLDSEQSLIGKPRRNIRVYILDENGHLCPIGVHGEICISGVGLARGYLNNPELTGEKFKNNINKKFLEVSEPFFKKVLTRRRQRLYKTGDRGSWQPDGNIRYLGRVDDQIKIRGNRVEIQEIENVIKGHQEIKDAVVVTRENQKGEIEICAYYIPKPGMKTSLREYIEKRLPSYMVPTHLLELEKIPMTPNGKVDKNALPEPGEEFDGEYQPPRNRIEEKLVEIWSEVLGRPPETIGIHHNFFNLGGHSLKVAVLTSRIQKQLEVEIPVIQVFKTPTISGQAEYLKRAGKSANTSIEAVEIREYYELAPEQKRLYILQQMDPGSPAYNVHGIITLDKPMGKERLEEIFKKIIRRHEILRTSYEMIHEMPRQKVHDNVEFEIEILGRGDPARPPQQTKGAIIKSFIRPFDLSRAPLLRVGLIKEEEDKYILAVDMHHIICDPISHEVLAGEINALCKGGELPGLKLQYKDYAGRQNSETQKAKIKQQENYWINLLSGDIPELELPMDFPRPQIQSFEGASLEFILGREETRCLKDIARTHQATQFMIIQALFNILLSKLGRQEEIIVGTPVSTRQHEDTEKMIGMFVNTLVMRNEPPGQKSFGQFLRELKIQTLAAYSNADYPFEELAEKIVAGRKTNRNPLFDVMFNYIREPGPPPGEPGAENDKLNLQEKSTSKFDITLTAVEYNDNILFNIEYCTRLYKEETIERIAGYFKKIIASVIEDPGRRVAGIEIISEEEKRRILFEINDTTAEYPKDKSIHGLYEEQVKTTPDHIAIFGRGRTGKNTDGNMSITYRQLNEQSNRQAYLLIEKGVLADTIVAILMERSVEMIIGILGILKSGGAYLPIEPGYPPDRIDYMLKDSGANVMVTTGNLAKEREQARNTPTRNASSTRFLSQEILPNGDIPGRREGKKNLEIIFLDILSSPSGPAFSAPNYLRTNPFNLAYVIYTSGSTGNPKGVTVEHASVVNLLYAMQREYPFGVMDTYLLKTSYIFDVSVIELFGWYMGGGRVVALEKGGEKDPHAILESIERNFVSYINFVPSMFNAFTEQLSHDKINRIGSLKYIFSAGEVLLPGLVMKFKNLNTATRLENIYGPTESTVYAGKYSLALWSGKGSIPIGKPLPNIRLYILNKNDLLQPCGLPGELCIGGTGLARGYINRPCLTAEKFDRDIYLWDSPDNHDEKKNYKLQNTNYKQNTKYKIQITNKEAHEIHELTRIGATSNQKFLWGGLNQWVSGSAGQLDDRQARLVNPLLMMPRLHPGTNENQHHRFAQHIGSPRRGAPGRRRQRLYRTGDLARWLPEGNIEFLGRIDHQVKIRGFRIELGEIENCLLKARGVKEAVLLAREKDGGDKYICAYFVSNIEQSETEMREYLLKNLPDYMVPSYFVKLEKIPLTVNGKLDRRALPEPVIKANESYTAPGDDIEKKLVDIWSGVLGVEKEKIGINDNFFHMGGHSLKATILAAKIHRIFEVKVPLAEIFKTPRIKELSGYIKKKANHRKYKSIEPVEKKEYYPLSSAQKRLYVIQQTDPARTVYNMPAVMTLQGELHREKFAGIFKKLIQRHESLRTSFHLLKEKPVQKIHDNVKFEIQYYHIQAGTETPEKPLDDMVENFVRPFDLETAPLLRVRLIKQDARKHILMIDMNHIISDGTSMGIFINEFMALNAGKDLEPLRIQNRDWAQRQNHEKNSGRVKNQEAYWLREYEGKIPVLNLPNDNTRPAHRDDAGKRVTFALPPRETEYLKTLARQEEVTPYMLLLSVYYVLLYKLTGQEEIIIGAPTAGRSREELQKIIGMFLNTLALRNFPRGAKPFNIFLKEVKTKVLTAFENQEYQFDDLVERLEVKRGGGRNPLFDVMFILQNQGTPEIQIPGLKLKTLDIEQTTTKFDISLYAEEVGHELVFSVTFSEKLFTPATIAVILDYYKVILATVLKNPGQALADIKVITGERRTAILTQLNRDLEEEAGEFTAGGFIQAPLNKSIHQNKDHVAIESKDQSLSYSELDRGAERLSRFILRKGIARGTFMGILVERRIDFISIMTAILKAGGVMVPLYSQLPIKRLEDMIQVIGVKYIFADSNNIKRFEGPERIEGPERFKGPGRGTQTGKVLINPGDIYTQKESLKREPPPAVSYSGGQQCYIYFTSGSTGKPKPIVGKNISLLHFINWEINTFGITADFRVSQFTIPTFDPFLRDVFVPLLAGAKICIPGEKETLIDPEKLAHWVNRRQINLIHCVPALFRLLNADRLSPGHFKSLKFILLAGEKINPTDLVDWYRVFGDRIQLVNMYGPTETTMTKVYYLIKPRDIYRERIPIGSPIKGTRVIILDKNKRLCAPLQAGEIYIRTPFRSSGYYNNPKLNKEKFITNPLGDNPKDILYRSGDLGRKLADGNIDILGRIDRQVKIRGYRIELEEVESALLQESLVKEAVVILKGNSPDREYLCAQITIAAGRGENSGIDPAIFIGNLKQNISARLPDYMVPAKILIMESIPRKVGGKVDYEKLADLVEQRKADEIAPETPATEIEKKLVKIWAEILKIEKIGIRDNFFEMGGNSLNVVSLVSKIHHEFEIKIPVAELFNIQTVSKQARMLKEAGKDKQASPEALEEKEYYPLSAAQRRLYVMQQIDPTGISYNMPRQALLEGELDKSRLEQAIKKLLQRHESLRTSFITIEDEPVQKINEEVEFEIEIFGHEPMQRQAPKVVNRNARRAIKSFDQTFSKVWPVKHRQEPPEATERSYADIFSRPFDLTRAPLMRIGLIKTGEKTHILKVDMHHIITDGISETILYRDFMELYHNRELPPLKLRYKDFSHWQNHRQQKMERGSREEFWKKQYQGEIPVLNLPSDFPRPPIKNFAGNTITFNLEERETAALNRMASANEATLYMVLLAIINILLSKLSGQEEIVIGTPTAGRIHADSEQIIGMFVNTLAIKNNPNGEKTFTGFLKEVKKRTLECIENQEYPFETLVGQLPLNRDTARNPLFDVMLVLQNMARPNLEIPGLKLKPREYEKTTARFDLNWTAVERDKKLYFDLEYSTCLFKRETIERYAGYLIRISRIVGEAPETRISQIEILPEAEKHRLLNEFNETEIEYDSRTTVHEKIAGQVEKTPANIALSWAEVQITYLEMEKRSHRLAGLLKEKGVVGGAIVGIMMGRSGELVNAILGILKAGAAYMPIDPGYPKARIDYMIKDSGVKILLTEKEMGQWLSPSPEPPVKLSAGRNFTNDPAPKTNAPLAYSIYTSGSTGKPKGVLIGHRPLLNFITGIIGIIGITPGDILLSLTPVSFDIFGLEIFVTLTVGAGVVMGSREEQMDVEMAGKTMQRRQITILQVTPSRLMLMISGTSSARGIKNLRYLLVGGEAFPEYLLGKVGAITRGNIYNLYGPTETTIWSTAKELTGRETVNIGKPIANTRVYLLDKYLKLSPIGVSGELHIGGDGLSVGYVNKPGLTAEKFIHAEEVSFRQVSSAGSGEKKSPGKKIHRTHRSYKSYIYRTGDLARWQPDGNIQFLGRMDTQVKIRGHRIELGEIEKQLSQYGPVKDAVVIDRADKNGDKYLCAYVVLNPSETIYPEDSAPQSPPISSVGSPELKNYLLQGLPDYMIPSYYVIIDRIPLTGNGKVDGKALPAPEIEAGIEYVAPRDEVETGIVYILSEILGIEKSRISVRANFFEIGINSITILKLAQRISGEFKIDIPMGTLFTNPSVEAVAAKMKKGHHPGVSSRAILLNRKKAGRNLFLISGDGRVYIFKELAILLEGHFNVYGVLARGIMETGKLPETRQEIYDDFIHEIKLVQPEGPYILGGHCFGAIICYEMTRNLEERKNEVTRLIFFDEPAVMVDKIIDYIVILRWYNKSRRAVEMLKKAARTVKMKFSREERTQLHKLQKTTKDKPAAMPEDLEARRKEIDKNYRRLLSTVTHFSRIVKAPLLAIKADDSELDPNPRWNPKIIARLSKKSVEQVKTPGDHYSMFESPQVAELAKRLIEKT